MVYLFTGFLTVLLSFQAFGEIAVPNGGTTAPISCPAEVMEENRRIRSYCADHWEEWELDPPPEHELRQVGECNSALQQAARFAGGCVENTIELLVMLSYFAFEGSSRLPQPHTPDSDEQVFSSGTEQEILARLSRNWLRDRCGLGAVDGAGYVIQQCPDEIDESDNNQLAACRNLALGEVREQQRCARSPETRREMLEGARIQLENQAREIHSEREAREAEEQEARRRVRVITQECRERAGLINTSSFGLNTLLRPLALARNSGQIISEWAVPDQEKVAIFNECARNHSLASNLPPELSPEGALHNLTERFDAFKCYNSQIRSQMACEIVTMAAGAGGALTAAGRLTLRRLGKSALQEPPDFIERGITEQLARGGSTPDAAAAAAATTPLRGLGYQIMTRGELTEALERNGIAIVVDTEGAIGRAAAAVHRDHPNIIMINPEVLDQLDDDIVRNILRHEATHIRTHTVGPNAIDLPEAVRRNYDGRRIVYEGQALDFSSDMMSSYNTRLTSDEAEAFLFNSEIPEPQRIRFVTNQTRLLNDALSRGAESVQIISRPGDGVRNFTVRIDLDPPWPGGRPQTVTIPVSLPADASEAAIRQEAVRIIERRLIRLDTIGRHYN